MSLASSPRGWRANRPRGRSVIAISPTSPQSVVTRQSSISAGCGLQVAPPGHAWGVAHIYFLIGFRNRLTVAIDWLWSYITYQRGARLITGQDM